jgi:hypothetical protein
MRPDTKEELELSRKLFELCEYERVEKICRDMMERVAGFSDDADADNEFRSLLIDVMIEVRDNDDSLEPILKELDRLFINYLVGKDRVSAARTLLRTAQFLEELDRPQALATGFKVIELFSLTDDENLLNVTRDAYELLYAELPNNSPRLVELCVSYGRFLERPIFYETACYTIMEIDEALDGEHNIEAIAIIKSFLSAKSAALSKSDREVLEERLAANYLFVGQNEAALEVCTGLLISSNDNSRLDYTLWCGEAFMNLDRNETAAMCFREVICALADQPNDSRAVKALEYLKELETN